MIQKASRVLNRKVLSHSDVTATVTSGGQPAPGVNVSLMSDQGAADTIKQPSSPTDSSGVTKGEVETRTQPATSVITSASPSLQTTNPASIVWLPSRYESSFLVTCYVVSQEADFSSTPLISGVNGLTPKSKYRSGFISDVRLQGSGVALDGTTIRYNAGGIYSISNCPLTATGACAVDGSTAAVDFTIVPRRGAIDIFGVGGRIAQDTGGAITGYHIDEYFGTRRSDCRTAGRRTLNVDFTNY